MDLKISKTGSRMIVEGKNSSTMKLDPRMAKKLMKYSKEYGDVYQRISDDISDGLEIDKAEMRELIYSLKQNGIEDPSAKTLANKLYKARMTDNNPVEAPVEAPTQSHTPDMAQTPDMASTQMPVEQPSMAPPVALAEEKISEMWKSVLSEYGTAMSKGKVRRGEDPSGVFGKRKKGTPPPTPGLEEEVDPRVADFAKRSDKKRALKQAQHSAGKRVRGRKGSGLKAGDTMDMGKKVGVDWNGFEESMALIREHEASTGTFLSENDIKSIFTSIFEKFNFEPDEGGLRNKDEDEKEEVTEGCDIKEEDQEDVDEAIDTVEKSRDANVRGSRANRLGVEESRKRK